MHHGVPRRTRRCRQGRASDASIFGQPAGRHERPTRFPGGRRRDGRRPGYAGIRPDGHARATAAGGRQVVSHRRRAGGRPRQPPRLGSRAARPGDRADRESRQIDQRRGGARFRPGTPGGDRRRPGAGARRAAAAARPADDREGVVQRRRPADDLGLPRLQGLSAGRGCRGGRAAEGCRRGDHRQDQCAGGAGRLAEHQSDLWHHQQSLRYRADARRFVGWLCRCAGGGLCGARGRLRHRRLAAHAGALLRRGRPQAELRHRADARPELPGAPGPAVGRRRPVGGRTDGA